MSDTQLPLPFDGVGGVGKTDTPEGDALPIIHAYTHEELVEDGGLIDVTDLGREAGFKWPVFVTDHLYYDLMPTDADKAIGQSITGRLWDVFSIATRAARSSRNPNIFFDVLVQRAGPYGLITTAKTETLSLWAGVGYNSAGEPHVVIGFPEDR